MIYVDVDSDSNTYNSSSTLSLSTENGAIPVVLQYFFAGLYWTGKSQDADSLQRPNEFKMVRKQLTNY
jgi:hypothetical protein